MRARGGIENDDHRTLGICMRSSIYGWPAHCMPHGAGTPGPEAV